MESPDLNAIFPRLPAYEPPPRWIPPEQRANNPDYDTDLRYFLPRAVVLRRNKASEALGFNVRGGKEHNCGIYVSKVMADSGADRLGLKEGDQILMVNNIDFESLDHADAVKVLKVNTTIEMLVRYFPYGYGRTYDKNRYQSLALNPSPGYK
ncbi:PDZ domain-containing protein 11-like [Babylonia areolata]|uniref:PDZ domain-containing protein 11-like n=1 Tax=Babylonia areolata TaxID=304850 RepID=UPI003FCF1939